MSALYIIRVSLRSYVEYRFVSPGADEDDVIGPEGMEKFCEDIGVEPENVRLASCSLSNMGSTGGQQGVNMGSTVQSYLGLFSEL